MNKKIIYFRNFAQDVNNNTYNSQEVGLGKALVSKYYDFDIIYYSSKFKKQIETEYINKENNKKIRIIRKNAIKIMNNSIFFSYLINFKKLKEYDFIITTEYNQIMTFFLCLFYGEKVTLYHGPYKDNSNIFIQRLYDIICLPIIKKKVSKVLTKSELSKEYLEKKGFKDVLNVGVGLDISKLKKIDKSNAESRKSNVKNILYVGKVEERRNYLFMIELIKKLQSKYDVTLTVVGDGEKNDLEKLFLYAKKLKISSKIRYIKKIEQEKMHTLYKNADVFILPTSYEIFGMVILESIYFNVPVITTLNGGSHFFHKNGYDLIIEKMDVSEWEKKMYKIFENELFVEQQLEIAKNILDSKYNWDSISNKFIY